MVDQKLLDAMKEYLDEGVKRDVIKNSLMKSGWSKKDIDKAFEKITGQKAAEEKKVPEKKIETPPDNKKIFSDNKKLFLIAGGLIIFLVLAVFTYLFLFKVGFSEDIPDNLPPGKLNNFIKTKVQGYNDLSLIASNPLKDTVQNGKVNLIMTDNKGTKIIDAIGVTIENSQIVSTALKVENPSFDVKFTEKMFNSIITSSNPDSVFLEGYSKGKIKIKSYGKENEDKLVQLNNFVKYFFVL